MKTENDATPSGEEQQMSEQEGTRHRFGRQRCEYGGDQ